MEGNIDLNDIDLENISKIDLQSLPSSVISELERNELLGIDEEYKTLQKEEARLSLKDTQRQNTQPLSRIIEETHLQSPQNVDKTHDFNLNSQDLQSAAKAKSSLIPFKETKPQKEKNKPQQNNENETLKSVHESEAQNKNSDVKVLNENPSRDKYFENNSLSEKPKKLSVLKRKKSREPIEPIFDQSYRSSKSEDVPNQPVINEKSKKSIEPIFRNSQFPSDEQSSETRNQPEQSNRHSNIKTQQESQSYPRSKEKLQTTAVQYSSSEEKPIKPVEPIFSETSSHEKYDDFKTQFKEQYKEFCSICFEDEKPRNTPRDCHSRRQHRSPEPIFDRPPQRMCKLRCNCPECNAEVMKFQSEKPKVNDYHTDYSGSTLSTVYETKNQKKYRTQKQNDTTKEQQQHDIFKSCERHLNDSRFEEYYQEDPHPVTEHYNSPRNKYYRRLEAGEDNQHVNVKNSPPIHKDDRCYSKQERKYCTKTEECTARSQVERPKDKYRDDQQNISSNRKYQQHNDYRKIFIENCAQTNLKDNLCTCPYCGLKCWDNGFEDEYSSPDQSDCEELLNLPYQDHDEYVKLLHELEGKLVARNRERFRRNVREFEFRSRQNQNLDQPISECRCDCIDKVLLQRLRQNCKCKFCEKNIIKQNSDIMQNEQRWNKHLELANAIQKNVPSYESRTKKYVVDGKTTTIKSNWKYDPITGEWYKICGKHMTPKNRPRSSPRSCGDGCTCCAQQKCR